MGNAPRYHQFEVDMTPAYQEIDKRRQEALRQQEAANTEAEKVAADAVAQKTTEDMPSAT
ncbi:MAG: hypothetical protein ACO26H_02175 [Sediminibacterium sp.]